MNSKPYYEQDGITIYHGDNRDILPALEPDSVDLVLTDPPYGINHPTDYMMRGRARETPIWRNPSCNNYPAVFGDDQSFDPTPWLQWPCILWGANYYADKLPPKSGWLVWDKERSDELDQATCELAWSNFVKGVRRFRYLWDGFRRKGSESFLHPTQKPVALMQWCLRLRWTPPGTVLDPYMGSGPVLIAAKLDGRRAIGIEIEERYCEIAARRLAQGVFDWPTYVVEGSP